MPDELVSDEEELEVPVPPSLDEAGDPDRPPEEDFVAIVAVKEARKVEALARNERSIWFGLGMFGMIGWSVTIPTLLCIALGVWIDTRWPSRYSWTLMLLFVGVALGCFNAWYWVTRERRHLK